MLSTPNGCTRNQRESYLSRKKPKARQKSSREGPVEPRNISEYQKNLKSTTHQKSEFKYPARQARPRQRSKCQIWTTHKVSNQSNPKCNGHESTQRWRFKSYKKVGDCVTGSFAVCRKFCRLIRNEKKCNCRNTMAQWWTWSFVFVSLQHGWGNEDCRVWKWELSSWKQQQFRESILPSSLEAELDRLTKFLIS